jgi:uncharacterized protein YndB with AHSA1/START domain
METTEMEMTRTVHSTFSLERSFKATPERVFAAFSDPTSKSRWNYTSEASELLHHEADFRVGGGERVEMKFGAGTPIAGMTITLESVYEVIIPNQRMVWAYRMALDGKTFSSALVTVELVKASAGTELFLTHQGAYFEGADGPEMRKGGWTTLLERLAKEVEVR